MTNSPSMNKDRGVFKVNNITSIQNDKVYVKNGNSNKMKVIPYDIKKSPNFTDILSNFSIIRPSSSKKQHKQERYNRKLSI